MREGLARVENGGARQMKKGKGREEEKEDRRDQGVVLSLVH